MTDPHFSIITVVLNDLAGLARTRDSIVRQRYCSFEWIVIDGASSDGTAAALEKWAPEQWLSEADSGIYDAMNKGLDRARGRWLVFLNARDELVDDDVLSRVARCVEQSGGEALTAVFGGANFRFRNGTVWLRRPRDMAKTIWHGLPANHQATYINRAVFAEFRYPDSYEICGDYCLAAEISARGGTVGYIEDPLVVFDAGGLSFSHPVKLVTEAYRIQRDILKVPLLVRCLSALRRIFATSIYACLYLVRR